MQLLPEWTPQDAIQLAWPIADSDWQPWLAEAETLYCSLVREISQYQAVVIACHPRISLSRLAQKLKDTGANLDRCFLYSAEYNDTWARDHGPIAAQSGEKPALFDFQFNGWGHKFDAALDNQVNQQLAAQVAYRANLIHQALVLEGGSIDTDGAGTLLTTTECLLNPNRNPSLSQTDLERFFSDQLSIEKILWLTSGHLEGDDTDAHVDTLARFCNEHTIAYVRCDDSEDVHADALATMEAELKSATNINNQPYQLVPLPWPQARYNEDGRRLPLTYANFLITNKQVLVPIYNLPTDEQALAQIRSVFTDRSVVGLDCSVLVNQFGSLHCITMQLPRGSVNLDPEHSAKMLLVRR